MDFQRDLVTLTTDGLRYYGIAFAVVILLISAWNAWLDIRKGKPRNQVYSEFGIMAAIAIAIAVVIYQLVDPGEQQVQIRYYGIIIVLAMLAATLFAAQLARRTGRDSEHVYGALTWAIIPGIVLSRLWYVLLPPETLCEAGVTVCKDAAWFMDNFFDTSEGAIAIWSGGLSIFGALLGGFIGVYLYLLKNKLTVPAWLDIAGVVLPLSQFIGRWASYVNTDFLGKPTCAMKVLTNSAGATIGEFCDSSWGMEIAGAKLPAVYRAIEYYTAKFHYLFLYEIIWSALAFLVLLVLFAKYRNRFRPGDFILLYVAQYAFIRFLLEFLHAQPSKVGDTNIAQVVTAVAFILSVIALAYRHRKGIEILPYEEAAPSEMRRTWERSRKLQQQSEAVGGTLAPETPPDAPEDDLSGNQ